MSLFSQSVCVVDVLSGQRVIVSEFPFKIGSGENCDLRLEDPALEHGHCVLLRKDRRTLLIPCAGVRELVLDGAHFTGGELASGRDYTLCAGAHFLALRSGTRPQKWLEQVDTSAWFLFDRARAESQGPFELADLVPALQERNGSLEDVIVYPKGLTVGFYAEHILPVLAIKVAAEAPPPEAVPEPPAPEPEGATIDTEYGEFTCPVCWLRFDRGDVMHIAVHAALRGDPVLGEDRMQRFQATRFNDRGQALDAMSIPAPDMACPHCRRKLPANFLDLPHHIFSIVGAPSSGKSYYLSVLVKTLQRTLYKRFGVSFKDADPSENVILNHMKSQLFSAATPAEAFLAKTELEGAMYETLPRLGRAVRLPKPFIFQLSARDPADDFSVVFYDNAGEHFEPTRNSAESPGAQHIAAASAIFFLFDPLHSTEFRRRMLAGSTDPQLLHRRVDQQDVILAETEVRMKSLLGLDARQRAATPLAMIVGKCDTWIDALGRDRIEDPIGDGVLDLVKVEANSALVRELLLEVNPAIVANAESISSDVMYFPASPLGSSPVEFTDARGVRLIGPDPRVLDPLWVETPTLWALSRIAPRLVPPTA